MWLHLSGGVRGFANIFTAAVATCALQNYEHRSAVVSSRRTYLPLVVAARHPSVCMAHAVPLMSLYPLCLPLHQWLKLLHIGSLILSILTGLQVSGLA